MRSNRTLAAGVLAAAVLLLVASIAFAAAHDGNGGRTMRFGPGMMAYATDSGDPVSGLDGARERVQAFAERLDLRVGEVMRFDRNYYAELLERDGDRATEMLVNPTDRGSTRATAHASSSASTAASAHALARPVRARGSSGVGSQSDSYDM